MHFAPRRVRLPRTAFAHSQLRLAFWFGIALPAATPAMEPMSMPGSPASTTSAAPTNNSANRRASPEMSAMPGMAPAPGTTGMGAMSFAGLPDSRAASGTSWQPDATPMFGQHFTFGEWQAMAHYNVLAGYDDQTGRRGDRQFASVNWLMLMATQRAMADEFTVRGMFSLEPWTTTLRGYPLLFQSGEAYQGMPLVDRQHPHNFFMEVAVLYRHALAEKTLLSVYAAAAGEPAIGPPAFPHRLSAMDNPAAPISHHWLDSTHIAFGVVTAGIVRDTWQLEGSWFNGREPDEHRWRLELHTPDSYSARLSWNPTPAWSAQVSTGHLQHPEQLRPDESVWRTTASVMNVTPLAAGRTLATTLAWGVNDSHDLSHAVLLESGLTGGMLNVFGRAEYVQKTGDELNLAPFDHKYGVTQLSVGASRELVQDRPWQLAVGATVSYSFAPASLDAVYGRHPVGGWIFVRLRAAPMMR